MIRYYRVRHIAFYTLGLLLLMPPAMANSTQGHVPWLDVPATWQRHVENGVVTLMPNDLPAGASFLMLVEPPQLSTLPLAQAYHQAITDLGPWRAVGQVAEDHKPNGWAYRFGVGVATLNDQQYTGLTAVAQRQQQRVRMWLLADSDATYNRYQEVIAAALASIQDIPADNIKVSPTKTPAPLASNSTPTKPDPHFGKGLSGVYVGVERGLSVSAGVGSGATQNFNPSTGRYETSNTGTAPQVTTQIGDYAEVDVFYPNGTYWRRLPVRGMASNFNWERQQQAALWGTWQRDGKNVIVQRGNYAARYTIEDETTLISDRGRPWQKLALAKNARLEGVFARGDYRDAAAPRLVLRADGSYEDRGDFLRMIGSAWNLVVPDGDVMIKQWNDAQARQALGGGSGTYTFDQFTLALHDRDGQVWQFNAYVPPGENIAKPTRLVINGRALLRD